MCPRCAAVRAQERFHSPDEALSRLIEGNDRFAAHDEARDEYGWRATVGSSAATRAALVHSQRPFAVVLTCADSRISPSMLFDVGLGSLFVVRNAGAVCGDMVVATVEYGVSQVHAPLVVVLGHEGCGAVTATLAWSRGRHRDGGGGGDAGGEASGAAEAPGADAVAEALSPATEELFKRIAPACDAAVAAADGRGSSEDAEKELLHEAIETNTRLTQRRLLEESAVLAEAQRTGKARVVAAVYSLATGRVRWLDGVKSEGPEPPAATKE